MSTTIIQKAYNEGSKSPFIARLFMGILELRDQVYLTDTDYNQKAGRKEYFDKKYHPLFEAAIAVRDAAKETIAIVDKHIESIEDGKAIKIEENQITVLETIDSSLRQSVDKLIDQSMVAVKSNLQDMLKDPLGLDIGFLFQKDKPFQNGVSLLRSSNEDDLSNYLIKARETWLSDLNKLRVAHEHNGWTLEGVKYEFSNENLVVKLPIISNLPIHVFARYTANRVLLFIENMIAYAIQRNSSPWYPIYISEFSIEYRDEEIPKRFCIAAQGLNNLSRWKIEFRDELEFL